jgi:RND family efflux transporter MFP subunit
MKRQIVSLVLALMVSMATLPAAATDSAPAGLAPIQLTPERRQLIGVSFATVQRRNVMKRIDTTGNIEPDEQLQSYVQTRFAGWIQQVYANQTYQYVRRGQPLFTVYSPDLASTEQEYLIALQAQDRVAASSVEGVADGAKSLAQAAAERLALLGVPESEIARLVHEKKSRNVTTIYSPASGYVVERNAFPNMYVQPDTKIYSITNFAAVWVYAAVFQDEIGAVKTGDPAILTIDAYPAENFRGRVDYIWPQIDIATRTARVRLAFDNRDDKLKPGMYGRVTLQIPLGEQTVIPAGGVLRTGTRNVAFIDRSGGYLTPTEVELGPRAGDDLVVIKGLQPGQRIVASANFLIDSESQLQAAAGNFVPPSAGISATGVEPSEGRGNQPAAAIEVATIPNPPARGKNQVRVTLRDSHGKGIGGAKVTVTFYMAAMPAMGMTAMRVTVAPAEQGDGVYQGDLVLASGGTWQVTAVATKDGHTLASKQFDLSATGGM